LIGDGIYNEISKIRIIKKEGGGGDWITHSRGIPLALVAQIFNETENGKYGIMASGGVIPEARVIAAAVDVAFVGRQQSAGLNGWEGSFMYNMQSSIFL
jgi:hypothetical protein